MIKVSVVVPVYNMEDKIKRCLDSLVNQTLKDIELIVINDGSKDKSDEIIKKYVSKYPNIIYINRSNKGISYTRNEGIKKAKGKYIGFVDSDDYAELDMYEKMYNILEETNMDIAICNYYKFNSDGKTKVNISSECSIGSISDNPKMIYKIDYNPWNKLYNRKLWNNVLFPDKLKYEDLEAVLKVCLKTDNIIYVDDYLYNYLINDNGETGIVDESVFDILTILDHLVHEFKDKDNSLQSAFEFLCCKKIFEYVHRIIDIKDEELSLSFLDKSYEFLNNYFGRWKWKYLKSFESFKDLGMRFLRINPSLYKLYIHKKVK